MKVTLNIEKKYAYGIIGLLVLCFGFLIVNAYVLVPGETPNPGHPISQVGPPAGCENGQFLQFSDGEWKCSVVDSGSMAWNDITNKPSGFADDIDDVGSSLTRCAITRFFHKQQHCTGTRIGGNSNWGIGWKDCANFCQSIGATCAERHTSGPANCFCYNGCITSGQHSVYYAAGLGGFAGQTLPTDDSETPWGWYWDSGTT